MRSQTLIEPDKLYWADLSTIPVLTHEEMISLFQKLKDGDLTARDKLINGNLRLVITVARYYQEKSPLELHDLIGYGNIGLAVAVDRYKLPKGVKFSTYAVWWIKHYIKRSLPNGKTVRIPDYLPTLQAKYRRVKDMLLRKLGRDPKDSEIAKEIKIPAPKLKKQLALVEKAANLSGQTISNEHREHVTDPFSQAHIDDLDNEFRKEILKDALLQLTEQERQVCILRFGLDGNEGLTLKQIGEQWGLCRERIRQIEKMALEKLFLSEEIRKLMD